MKAPGVAGMRLISTSSSPRISRSIISSNSRDLLEPEMLSSLDDIECDLLLSLEDFLSSRALMVFFQTRMVSDDHPWQAVQLWLGEQPSHM